jgi:hypothetical protein
MARPLKPRQRRPHGELSSGMREYLASKEGESALSARSRRPIEPKVGIAPASSYRSALQNEQYFERVSRGVFRLRTGA